MFRCVVILNVLRHISVDVFGWGFLSASCSGSSSTNRKPLKNARKCASGFCGGSISSEKSTFLKNLGPPFPVSAVFVIVCSFGEVGPTLRRNVVEWSLRSSGVSKFYRKGGFSVEFDWGLSASGGFRSFHSFQVGREGFVRSPERGRAESPRCPEEVGWSPSWSRCEGYSVLSGDYLSTIHNKGGANSTIRKF